MRRISLTLHAGLEHGMAARVYDLGATYCMVMPCETLRRTTERVDGHSSRTLVRLEILATLGSSTAILQALKHGIAHPEMGIICCEIVDVVHADDLHRLDPSSISPSVGAVV
jgi:hypothetical protein